MLLTIVILLFVLVFDKYVVVGNYLALLTFWAFLAVKMANIYKGDFWPFWHPIQWVVHIFCCIIFFVNWLILWGEKSCMHLYFSSQATFLVISYMHYISFSFPKNGCKHWIWRSTAKRKYSFFLLDYGIWFWSAQEDFKMSKQQKGLEQMHLNLLNWVLPAVRNLTLRVNEATVFVNAEMNSYASRTFVSYRLNNCGPFILFIKVQCMFASLHLQGSCRKASCSSSRESPMLFKAVMNMKKQYCLLSSSNCFTHHASW